MENMSKFNSPKDKKIFIKCPQKGMHMFNVWTMIMQSLNIKEWKLFELHITHHLSILNGKMSKFNPLQNEKNIREMCIK